MAFTSGIGVATAMQSVSPWHRVATAMQSISPWNPAAAA